MVLQAFLDLFWTTAAQMVSIFVPVIVIILLFKLLAYFILGSSRL